MKQLIELGAVRIGAVFQNVCANLDFEVLSLPGGCLIAILLWLYTIIMVSIRRTPKQGRASGFMIDARSIESERRDYLICACASCER